MKKASEDSKFAKSLVTSLANLAGSDAESNVAGAATSAISKMIKHAPADAIQEVANVVAKMISEKPDLGPTFEAKLEKTEAARFAAAAEESPHKNAIQGFGSKIEGFNQDLVNQQKVAIANDLTKASSTTTGTTSSTSTSTSTSSSSTSTNNATTTTTLPATSSGGTGSDSRSL
jgi:hypothetical protein